jgi:hypothetical protein
MPDENSAFENYLTGKPLSAEIAALMEGREPAAEIQYPQETTSYTDARGHSREPTPEEITWVHRLKGEPGYSILLRLLKLRVQKREESASLLSQQDPYGQKDDIAKNWAYIACFKQVIREIEILVTGE